MRIGNSVLSVTFAIATCAPVARVSGAAPSVVQPTVVTICELARNPAAFAGKLVRFHAEVNSDIHTALLWGRTCKRGFRFNLKFAQPPESANAIESVASSVDGTYGLLVEGTFVATLQHYDAQKYDVPYMFQVSSIVEFSIRHN